MRAASHEVSNEGSAGGSAELERGGGRSDRQDAIHTQRHDAYRRAIAAIPLVGTALLGVVYLVSRPAYYTILREDYPVEWLQFWMLLLSGLLAVATVGYAVRRREPMVAAVLLVVAVGTFFLAGEEISWGQRVFAFITPAELAAVNLQQELNVHNVTASGWRLQDLFKAVSFVIAVVGLALAFLTDGPRPRLRARLWTLLAVPRYTATGYATMVVFWIAYVTTGLNPVIRFQEWAEACLYLSVAATLVAIHLRMRRRGVQAQRNGRWTAGLLILATALVTVLFAALTVQHGIVPLNARDY